MELIPHDKIVELRSIMQAWFIPADEIPLELFQIGFEAEWTHELIPGHYLETNYSEWDNSQWYWLCQKTGSEPRNSDPLAASAVYNRQQRGAVETEPKDIGGVFSRVAMPTAWKVHHGITI